MGISYDDAYKATNPADSDDARKAAANAIVLGQAANDVYWDHRPELEALKAQAEGHGVVVRGPDEEGETPTQVASGTGSGPAIDSTATEEPPTALETGVSVTPSAGTAPGGEPVPSPDNPNESISRLRQQLRDAGISPEA